MRYSGVENVQMKVEEILFIPLEVCLIPYHIILDTWMSLYGCLSLGIFFNIPIRQPTYYASSDLNTTFDQLTRDEQLIT